MLNWLCGCVYIHVSNEITEVKIYTVYAICFHINIFIHIYRKTKNRQSVYNQMKKAASINAVKARAASEETKLLISILWRENELLRKKKKLFAMKIKSVQFCVCVSHWWKDRFRGKKVVWILHYECACVTRSDYCCSLYVRQMCKSNVIMIWCWQWMTVEKHNENANFKAIELFCILQAFLPFFIEDSLISMMISKKAPIWRFHRRLCRTHAF